MKGSNGKWIAGIVGLALIGLLAVPPYANTDEPDGSKTKVETAAKAQLTGAANMQSAESVGSAPGLTGGAEHPEKTAVTPVKHITRDAASIGGKISPANKLPKDQTSGARAGSERSVGPVLGDASAYDRHVTTVHHSRPAVSISQPSGLRDLASDYPDALIFNALDPTFLTRFTDTTSNDRATAIYPANVVPPAGSAYQVEQVILPFHRIASASIDTYLRIDIGELGGAGFVGEQPTDLFIDPITARIIVNTGHGTNSTCEYDDDAPDAGEHPSEDFDCWSIDLTTGDATSILDGTVYPNVIISNSLYPLPGSAATTGPVPIGDRNPDGSGAKAIGVMAGQWSGSQVIYGPEPDACVTEVGLTGPGGMVWMNWLVQGTGWHDLSDIIIGPNGEPGVGLAVGGIFADNTPFGDGDTVWEAGEGFWAGTTVDATMNIALDGSLGPDCNTNGVVDVFDIAGATSDDDNANGIPDECDCKDCNGNNVPDLCDVSCLDVVPPVCADFGFTPGACATGYPSPQCGGSHDCNSNGIPDECGADCNGNGYADQCDIDGATSEDCQGNGIPDECDIDPTDPDGDGFYSVDCIADGTPDECETVLRDCNGNDWPDHCDVLNGDGVDTNGNGALDSCEVYGNAVTLDFEDWGPDEDFAASGIQFKDRNYTQNAPLGPHVGEQPSDENAGTDTYFIYDWLTYDDNAGAKFVANGAADVVSNSSLCGGTQALKLYEIASNGTPTDDYAAMTPLIYFADPNIEEFFGWVPVYQEISMKLKFGTTPVASDLDWDIYFNSAFDDFINDYRVVVSLDSNANGDTFIIIYDAAGGHVTTVDWTTNGTNVNDLKVVIDLQNQTSVNLAAGAGKVFWNGNQIGTFHVNLGNVQYYGMDRVFFDEYRGDNGAGFKGTSVLVDCITLKRSDEFDPLVPDCNGNFANDLTVDIATGASEDCNNNRIPDECEYDVCSDCQINLRMDECDIAGGTSNDNNGNGIPDECEVAIPASVGFEQGEGFDLGEIAGQNNWFHIGDGGIVNEVPVVPLDPLPAGLTGVGSSPAHFVGDQILEMPVPEDNYNDPNIGLQYAGMPNYQGAEPGVEQWEVAAAMDVVSDADTLEGSEPLYIDIADYCDQGLVGWTTGVIFSQERVSSSSFPLWRKIKTWELVGDAIQERTFVNNSVPTAYRAGVPSAVRLLIRHHHYSGDEVVVISVNNPNATPGWTTADQTTTIAAGLGGTGGDKQIVFDSEQLESTKWFDEVKYTSDADCDWDGGPDSEYLGGSRPDGAPPSDTDGGPGHTPDGIPDRCQDCDLNGTLDVYELAGNDCNNNGVLDVCDIDPDLQPDGYVGWRDDPALAGQCPNAGVFVPGCFVVRYGGGSTDCDGNGTPDECQETSWGDFSPSPYLQGDCNENGTPDECEVAAGTSNVDADGNGQLDECADCNHNGTADYADIGGTSDDEIINATGAEPGAPADGIPDECCPNNFGADFNHDGKVDLYDFRRLQQCQGQVQRKTNDAPTIGDTFLRGCGCADLNEDGQVNGVDQKIFQLIVTGP